MRSQSEKRGAFGQEVRQPSAMAALARPSCSGCRGPVRWLGTGEAVQVLGAAEVSGLLGRLHSAMPGEWVEFWHCARCGESGAMS